MLTSKPFFLELTEGFVTVRNICSEPVVSLITPAAFAQGGSAITTLTPSMAVKGSRQKSQPVCLRHEQEGGGWGSNHSGTF